MKAASIRSTNTKRLPSVCQKLYQMLTTQPLLFWTFSLFSLAELEASRDGHWAPEICLSVFWAMRLQVCITMSISHPRLEDPNSGSFCTTSVSLTEPSPQPPGVSSLYFNETSLIGVWWHKAAILEWGRQGNGIVSLQCIEWKASLSYLMGPCFTTPKSADVAPW